MDKKSKIITGSVVAILAVGGISYAAYSNAQHQQAVKVAAAHKAEVIAKTKRAKAKETAEIKQVNDLQKAFVVTAENSEKVFSDLISLKLLTSEAKTIQSKAISADKKAFTTLTTQDISRLDISTTDSKFNDIANLQTNVQALTAENKKLSAMTNIFTGNQIKNFSSQISAIIKKEQAQITALQKAKQVADEKAKAAAAKAKADEAKKAASTMNLNQIMTGDLTTALSSISGTWTNSAGDTIQVSCIDKNAQQSLIVIKKLNVLISSSSVGTLQGSASIPNGQGFQQGELTGGMLDISIDGSTSGFHLVMIPAGVKYSNQMAPDVTIQDNTDSSKDRMILVSEATAGSGAVTTPIDAGQAYYHTSDSVGN